MTEPNSLRRALHAAVAVVLVSATTSIAAEEGAVAGDLATNIAGVEAVAGNLETNIAGLEQALSDSINSREQGAELLDQMQASAEAVFAKLAQDSEIWTALTKAMQVWDDRKTEMLEKSETNPAFKLIADEWDLKVAEANKLRKQILEQRAESMALLDQIAADREVVLAYYELGQADRALDTMKNVSGELGRMNDSMRAIVDQTMYSIPPPVPVAPPPVPIPPADWCGTREDMDLRIGEVEERFGEFRQTINAANRDLPTYREDARDTNKVCTPQVEGSIASAISKLDRLEIETVYDMAVEVLACVDQRRRTIDGEMSQLVISNIQLRRLNDEMERLTDTTHRVQDMEQALLAAVAKRRRLVEELMQIKQEVLSACAT